MLAIEGSSILLLALAGVEGDKSTCNEELLRAGAEYEVKDGNGRIALDRANPMMKIKDFILNF